MSVRSIYDRRLYQRYWTQLKGRVKLTKLETWEGMKVRNASASGLKIETHLSLFEDEDIDIDIVLPDEKGSINLKVKVVWSVHNESEIHNIIGVEVHENEYKKIQRIFNDLGPSVLDRRNEQSDGTYQLDE